MPHPLKSSQFLWLLRALVVGSLLLTACAPGAGPFTANAFDADSAADGYPYPGPTNVTPDHEVEFVGVINRIGPEIWVIGDHEVIVTPDTEIAPGVELGAWVKVQARRRADDSLLALKIKLPHDDEHTPEPTRTRAPDHTPKVTRTREATRTPAPTRTREATRTAEPTRTTTREPEPTTTREPEPTTTREPTHTATREPEHTATREPTHTATREPEHTATREPTHTHEPEHTATREPTHTHEPEHTPEPTRTAEPTQEPTTTPASEIEFTGTLTAIHENVWTIGDHTVIVTDDTEIHGGPHIGDMVEVHGWPQPDGAVLAREISKL